MSQAALLLFSCRCVALLCNWEYASALVQLYIKEGNCVFMRLT